MRIPFACELYHLYVVNFALILIYIIFILYYELLILLALGFWGFGVLWDHLHIWMLRDHRKLRLVSEYLLNVTYYLLIIGESELEESDSLAW